MAWTTTKVFNFRATTAFTTDNAGQVCYPGPSNNLPSYPQSATLDSDTWAWGWSVGSGNDGTRDRTANIPSSSDHRLAGLHMNSAGTLYTLKMQIGTSPGVYQIGAAFGDSQNACSSISWRLRDSTTTLIATVSGSTASGGFMDIAGNVYTSGANWAAASGGGGVLINVTTGDTTNGNGGPFFFLDVGVSGTALTPISNFQVQFLPNAPVVWGLTC